MWCVMLNTLPPRTAVVRSIHKLLAHQPLPRKFHMKPSETMKRTHLLAAVIATAIPFATVLAEDTTKPDATDQTKEQNDCCKGMMGKDMGMMGMGKDMGMMGMDM